LGAVVPIFLFLSLESKEEGMGPFFKRVFFIAVLLAIGSGAVAVAQMPKNPAPEYIKLKIEKLVKLESVQQGELWDWCVLFIGYNFTVKKSVGAIALIRDKGAYLPKYDLLASLENDQGYLISFHEDKWGGNSSIKFRKGEIGSCPTIPVFISDGTEALIDEKIYIYQEGKWFSQQ
jgi:hypothetical protein